jgi:hypothetical protein
MTRRRTLFIVAALTILGGSAQIWSFLSPMFDPNKPKVLDPVQLILGTLFLLVGWGLFRRNEFALEMGFWLWFMSLIWSALSTVFFLGGIDNLADFRNLMAVLFLSLLILMQLLVIIFLGQKETKRLFFPDSAESADVSMKNVESPK